MKKTPADVRIVLAGGDKVLHHFLCAYASILQLDDQLLKGLNLKFYIIPTMRNQVAAFLARRDSWYNRHVYIPFRSAPLIVPWLNVDEDTNTKDENDAAEPMPLQFYRHLMEDYLREAQQSVRLYVYKMEGWNDKPKEAKDSKDTTTELADLNIPIIGRFEVGCNVYAAQYRAKKGISEEKTVEELFKQQGFTFVPPEVKVKFTKVDFNGKPQQTFEDDPAPYVYLQLVNIPVKGDKGFLPDPTSPWLEMYAQVPVAFKPRAVNKKNVLVTDTRQHIHTVEITALPDQKFDVMIDQQLFGPLSKVRITPLEKDGKRVTFPVQTFFPLDL